MTDDVRTESPTRRRLTDPLRLVVGGFLVLIALAIALTVVAGRGSSGEDDKVARYPLPGRALAEQCLTLQSVSVSRRPGGVIRLRGRGEPVVDLRFYAIPAEALEAASTPSFVAGRATLSVAGPNLPKQARRAITQCVLNVEGQAGRPDPR